VIQKEIVFNPEDSPFKVAPVPGQKTHEEKEKEKE
jgi:hypothetical protein